MHEWGRSCHLLHSRSALKLNCLKVIQKHVHKFSNSHTVLEIGNVLAFFTLTDSIVFMKPFF